MVRIDDSESETKCWLTYPEEVQKIEEKARERDWEQEILVQLCARVGCRISDALTAEPQNVKWNSDGEYWEIKVWGKNTKGGEKTVRDAYVPDEVKKNLDRYQSERDIDSAESYVQISNSRARDWIREITNEIAEENGNERWKHVSSHDLRRSWATHHLVERSVNVRVMMEIGGWSSYQAIEPYLGKPTHTKIGNEMTGDI